MKARYAIDLSLLFSLPEKGAAVPVYCETFAAPSSTSWSYGSDVSINTSVWSIYANGNFGCRISNDVHVTHSRIVLSH